MFLASNRFVDIEGRYSADGFEHRLHAEYIPKVAVVSECPVCGHGHFIRLAYPPNFRAQETIFLQHEKTSQFLWMCDRCGLIQVRNVMPPDFYFEYINSEYANASYPRSAEDIARNESFYRIKHRFAWRHVRPSGRVLEVSSFWGTGLHDLASTCDVYGLEAENAAARFSIDYYPTLRGRIVNDVLENGLDELRKVGPFDHVLFSYTFRQIAHPLPVLNWLRDAVVPGGYVLIAEGPYDDLIFWELPKVAATHFFQNKAYYYNLFNLDLLMGGHGFHLVRSDAQFRDQSIPFDQSIAIFQRGEARQPQSHREGRLLSDSVWSRFISVQP